MSTPGDLSRRDLLSGRVFGGSPGHAQAAQLHPSQSARYRKSFPVLRPPGAVEEEAFLVGCTKCEACIEACPHEAIVHAPIRFRRAAGTPMIDPIHQPCWMCTDYPCIASCEPGVLRFDLPVTMGIARIDTITCLAHQGSACTACMEQCPVPGAIVLRDGRPRIDEDICTGCGVCQHVCPAPQNAVLLMPLSERLAAPGPGG